MAVATKHHVLSNDILDRCAERAPVYDRENRFFAEDFEEGRVWPPTSGVPEINPWSGS